MAFDGRLEAAGVTARLLPLAGGRVHRGIVDDEQLAIDPASGEVRPYISLRFNAPIAKGSDRSMEGERTQPYLYSGIVECWAPTEGVAADLAAAALDLLLGFAPGGDNSSELRLRGGGDFRFKDSATRPSLRMSQITWECEINMSIDE